MLETLRNSPIVQAEVFYWQQRQSLRNRWRGGVFVLTVIFAFLNILAILPATANYFRESEYLILFIYFVLTIGLHFELMLHTLSLSVASITREKWDAERWAALLLTGVSGRDIVLGKWWAVVQSLWRSYLLLGLLRAIDVGVLTIFQAKLSAGLSLYPTSISTTPLHFIVGGSTVIVLTLINLPYTAAWGVMSAALSKRGGKLSYALATRALFLMLLGMLFSQVWYVVERFGPRSEGMLFLVDWLRSFLAPVGTILLDNGVDFVLWLMRNDPGVQHRWLTVIILSVAVYSLLTWLLLGLAQRRIEKQ